MKNKGFELLKKPFVGTAYYPEDWRPEDVENDIRKMKEAGITCVRMAEFAWRLMEPSSGVYDFSWLHEIIDRLGKEGIYTILGTPTATPPIWLSELYPDVMVLNKDYRRWKHGGRRHCCSNNPKYVEYSMRIVEKMAQEFGKDENVIGWQIDNEMGPRECRCPYCVGGFREFLKEKYVTVENLNDAWDTNIFSQRYDNFAQVPFPDNSWHNPHIVLDQRLFDSSSQAKFVSAQIDILKKYTDMPIGTNTMPHQRAEYEKLVEKCDIIQYDHYDNTSDLNKQFFWFDYLRTLKTRPFWCIETSATWGGGNDVHHSMHPYGFTRANSWLPIIHGGEANMYWVWRAHWGGHEMMHGSVIQSSGLPTHVFPEVQRVAKEFEKASDFVTGTKVITDTAFHFSGLSWHMQATQPMIKRLNYQDTVIDKFYHPISRAGIRPDVIDCTKDLSKYKLLFSPMLITLEQGDILKQIGEWVQNGGVWAVGPMSDLRDQYGARFKDSIYGYLEELTGAKCLYEIPDTDGLVKCCWNDGESFEGHNWYELMEGGESLVQVSEGYPTLVGKSPFVRCKVGKGVVYLLGTFPSEADMQKIIGMAAEDAGVNRIKVEGVVTVTKRSGSAGEGLMIAECGNQSGSVELDCEMTDILTGKKYSGNIDIAPYDVLILKK